MKLRAHMSITLSLTDGTETVTKDVTIALQITQNINILSFHNGDYKVVILIKVFLEQMDCFHNTCEVDFTT